MTDHGLLYAHGSLTITVALFAMILLTNEAGFRMGRFVQASTDAEIKELTGSIQGSVLGILALLLGFTFSMSMQRFDLRSHALIDEANAIGTARLRAELLPGRLRDEALRLLSSYVDVRTAAGDASLVDLPARRDLDRRTSALQSALWNLGVAAANEDPRPTTTGAFISALTSLLDAHGKRSALLRMHVPEVVLILLFFAFMSSGGILGYSSGLGGRRVIAPTALVSFLIAMVVFIIIDLDRPRRGLIQVDQAPMLELQVPGDPGG